MAGALHFYVLNDHPGAFTSYISVLVGATSPATADAAFTAEIGGGGGTFVWGIDNSDSDKWKLQGGTSLGGISAIAVTASQNVGFFENSANYQSMALGMFIGTCATPPTGDPTDGVFLYVESGALKARFPSGNIVTLGS